MPKGPTPEPTGLETSSGIVGRWVGAFSRWFRLPWVPLFGAGFSPSKSARGGCRTYDVLASRAGGFVCYKALIED